MEFKKIAIIGAGAVGSYMLWGLSQKDYMEVRMGKISKAIEKKKKELMWLKIKLGMKVGAIVLLPIIVGIVIHFIKKKAKKNVKEKIKESIRCHAVKKQEDDEINLGENDG